VRDVGHEAATVERVAAFRGDAVFVGVNGVHTDGAFIHHLFIDFQEVGKALFYGGHFVDLHKGVI